jgi:acyl-homoserine lactone synthase
MIHLIHHANRHLYAAELEALHALRRRCFVEERGWDLPSRGEGEYDAYDDEQAAYLVGFDPARRPTVACRIRPTAAGGVLPDLFPHLIAPCEPHPARPGTYECTRYLADPASRGTQGFWARSRLHLAMVEYVRDVGGNRLLGFVDLPLLTHLRRFSGLRIRPVGFPTPYGQDGAETIAFEIGVTAEDLTAVRRRLQLPPRQLFTAPAWPAAGFDVFALEQATAALLAAPGPAAAEFEALAARLVPAPGDPRAAMARLAEAA